MSRRVIDCTQVLRHRAEDGFSALEFEREGQPQALAHRIEMNADVGTHVLAPRRYARWGSDLAGLAPETFFGEGLVAHIEVTPDAPDIDSERLEDAFGRNLRTRDIVVIAARGQDVVPCFTAQAAQWLFVHGAKLVALADGVSVGREQEPDDERVILTTLLETDVPVVRGLVNTEQLSTERMAFMALPAAAADLTAWPVRFIALDPGLAPTDAATEDESAVDQPDEAEDPTEAETPAEPAPAEPEPEPEPDEPSDDIAPEPTAEDDQPSEEPAPEPSTDEDQPSSQEDQPSTDEAPPQDDPDETDSSRPAAEA